MDIYFILWIIVQYDFIKLFQLWPLGALLVVSYVLWHTSMFIFVFVHFLVLFWVVSSSKCSMCIMFNSCSSHSISHFSKAGVPNRNPAAQQKVSHRWARKASYVLTATPHGWHYHLSSTSCQISPALDSHWSMNPAVNGAWEGSRLCTSYETLMPDDLRQSWGADASAGEQLQIQIIISREVGLHRDHNKSVFCRLISKPYQWVASEQQAASGGRL